MTSVQDEAYPLPFTDNPVSRDREAAVWGKDCGLWGSVEGGSSPTPITLSSGLAQPQLLSHCLSEFLPRTSYPK
jgi:hypothetical protein